MTGARVRRPDLRPLFRSALGGVAAVALVAGGIVVLQQLVPEEYDTPAVVRSSDPATFVPTAPPATTPVVEPTAEPPTPGPGAARPALTVLNNSRIDGLATRAARDFTAGGWRVAATGNLRGRTPRTTVYYDPGQQQAAAALRKQFPKVLDALPRPAGLPGGGTLTVVVTRDYAA